MIWLEVVHGHLRVTAYDKPLSSIEQAGLVADVLRDGAFGLHYKDARALTKQLPADFGLVTVEVDSDGLLNLTAGAAHQRRQPAADRFIDYRQLLDRHRTKPVGSIAFAPKLLAKLARHQLAEPPAIEVVFGGRTAAARVHIGGYFTALLVPVRLDVRRAEDGPAPTRPGRGRPAPPAGESD